jgi:hypothetical protein
VLLIFGIRRKAYRLATVFTLCSLCQTPAAQAITRVRMFFTLFFVPLIPLGSKYTSTCTLCGRSVKLTKEAADNLASAALTQNVAPRQSQTDVSPGIPSSSPQTSTGQP